MQKQNLCFNERIFHLIKESGGLLIPYVTNVHQLMVVSDCLRSCTAAWLIWLETAEDILKVLF